MHNVDILYIHIYFYDFKLYTVLKNHDLVLQMQNKQSHSKI